MEIFNNHRAAFDTELPPEQVWHRIQRCLDSADDLEQFIAAHRVLFDRDVPQKLLPDPHFKKMEDTIEAFVANHRTQFDTVEPPEKVWESIVAANEQDDLVAFIQNNRTQFDTQSAPETVWKNILNTLAPLPALQVSWKRNLLRAAAAITLLLTCFLAGMQYANHIQAVQPMYLSDVSEEYGELEAYYNRDIAGKKAKLANFSVSNESLNDDLAHLDLVLAELKNELAHVPPGNREQVVRAMIDNYKAKSAILEKVLQHLNTQQEDNFEQHEIKNI